MADKSKIEIYLTLIQDEFKRGLGETKKAIANLGSKVDLNLDTDKAKGAVRSLLDEIKTGFAREIGAQAFQGITGLLQSAAGQAQNLAQQIFNAGKETESLQSRLAQAVGGEGAAARIFQELTDFAAKTPLEINEIVNSFISLKQRGIEPTVEKLTKLGDIAKSQGKSLQQFVEAVLDAQSGENERLKEFGIQASKSGDQVTFSFNGITKTVKATNEAIAEALIGFGELPNVVGGMDRAAQTIEGRLSTLSDAFKANLVTIFDGFQPAISGVITFISTLTEQVNIKLKDAFLGLNLEAKQFADYLNANPEIIGNIASGVAELAGNLASSLLSGARQLAEYLSKNPDAINKAVDGVKTFAVEVGKVASAVANIVSGFASIPGKLNEVGQAIADNGGADTVQALREFTGGFFGLENLGKAVEQAKQQTNETAAAFDTLGKSIGGTADKGLIRLAALQTGIKATADEAINKAKEVVKVPPIDFKKNLDELQKANAAAEAAVKTSTTNQIIAIKQLGLTREEESKRLTALELTNSTARVAAIKAEIAQIKAAQASGQIDPKAAQDLLLKLNDELASANLARIEKVRAVENALRAEIIAGIEAQALKQKLADNERIAGADKVLQSLKREQDLFSARSGLEAAQGDLAKTRLENQLKITEAIGNEGAAQQLKLQIQQQEIANQERVFAAQLKSLEITQQIKAAELQRQAILDKIAIAESEIALKKLAQKEGVSKDELALQQQVIEAQREKAALTNQAIADQTTFNQIAKEELLTKQQAMRETQQTNIVAESLKAAFSGATTAVGATNTALAGTATAINTATNAAGQLNTAIAGMTENTKALVQQALAVKEAFRQGATAFNASATGLGGNIQTAARGADGKIGSSPGQTIAQQQAAALAANIKDPFAKQAFLLEARANELSKGGIINAEQVSINGQTLDIKEAADLFGRAAQGGYAGDLAKRELETKAELSLVGSVVAGGLNEALKIAMSNLTGRLPSFARGVENFSGGLAYVHQGEVLANLPRGTDVIPKNVLRGGTKSNAPVTTNNTINIVNRPNPSADITAALLATR